MRTTWYGKTSAGDHQGLVISEETGANIAVAYDKKDTDMLAAAPDLLTAIDGLLDAISDLSDEAREEFNEDAVLAAIAAAGKARGV